MCCAEIIRGDGMIPLDLSAAIGDRLRGRDSAATCASVRILTLIPTLTLALTLTPSPSPSPSPNQVPEAADAYRSGASRSQRSPMIHGMAGQG